MRAILIDPFKSSVSEVSYNGDWKTIYQHLEIGDRPFCTVRIDQTHYIFLDDEGLFQPDQKFFSFSTYPQPLAGRGLILGSDEEGESFECTIPLSLIQSKVTFPDLQVVGMEMKEGEINHPLLGPTRYVSRRPVFSKRH